MKLSTRCRYGLRAMIEIARHYNSGPVTRKDIARNQEISAYYLENILIALKARNLIKTVRGAHGGFTLEALPENISMYDIVTALEGTTEPVSCVENANNCKRAKNCSARIFWQELHESIVRTLKARNLQSLVDINDKDYALEYCI